MDTHWKDWKAISAPSLENLPRILVNVPSVGTVPEGISTDLSLTGQWAGQSHNCLDYKLSRRFIFLLLPPVSQPGLGCESQSIILCELQCEELSYLFLACSELCLSCIKNEFKPTRKHCELADNYLIIFYI